MNFFTELKHRTEYNKIRESYNIYMSSTRNPSLDKSSRSYLKICEDLKTALEKCDPILAKDPNNYQVKIIKARILKEYDLTDESLELLLEVISRHPESLPEPYGWLADIYYEKGEVEKSIEFAKMMLAHPDKHWSTMAAVDLLIHIYSEQDRIEEAKKYLQMVVSGPFKKQASAGYRKICQKRLSQIGE